MPGRCAQGPCKLRKFFGVDRLFLMPGEIVGEIVGEICDSYLIGKYRLKCNTI
jgi:hypothetical protein